MDSAEVVRIIAASKASRVAAVRNHLDTIAALGRMVDQLSELHADLDDDDRLHQVLHALGFCWLNVEAELLAVVKSLRN